MSRFTSSLVHLFGLLCLWTDSALAAPRTELTKYNVGTGLTWTGRVFADQGEITLKGDDLESIYADILLLNPSYHASINANLTRRNELSSNAANTQLNCGMEDCKTGEYRYATQAESMMYDAGGYIGAPARTCQRMTCRGTTGTYFCNDNNAAVGLPASDLAVIVGNIRRTCCPATQKTLGQYWTEIGGVNIWVAYSECSQSNTKAPTTYGFGPGPNGICR